MHTRSLFTKRSRQGLMRAFGTIGILGLLLVNFPAKTADAAQLTVARLYLNHQQADTATGEMLELFFKPATTLSGSTNHVVITFPNNATNNGKWCRTPGTLTLTAITDPTATVVPTESATGLLGTITGACTSTPDTFTISAVGALLNSTKYGVRMVGNTAVLGTSNGTSTLANNIKVQIDTQQASTPTDTFTLATAVVPAESYLVTASVDPTLSVTLSGTTLNLLTLDSTHVNTQGVTSQITTNAKNGYVSVVSYSGTFSNGVDTIADAGGTATAGASSFGAATSKSSQTIAADTSTCTTSAQTLAGPYASTALSSSTPKEFASAAAPVSGDSTTLCFLAAVSGTQAPGTYTTTVTLVTTARF